MKKSIGAGTYACPTPVWCVGSYDAEGKPNVMTVAWGGVCCSKPPAVGVSLRKATYSYAGVLERKAFTVSVPSSRHAREADYFGMASGRDTDKFAVAGLTAARSGVVDAPYVAEFPLVLECRVIHVLEIGLHTQFVGEVMDVKAEENVLDDRGRPMLERIMPLLYDTGCRVYHTSGEFVGKGFSMGKEL